MCGIGGKLYFDPARTVEPMLLERMNAVLAHRGPDDAGTYRAGQVGLANRRLSIIDLSPAGHQPMSTADGTLWITYNGEIYNFLELRAHLERAGVAFRSKTDTEVILALYQRYGVDCLRWLRGMFAFAIWDAGRHTLFLARDRLGKKPLFYFHDGDVFVFGSEPKAILQDPSVAAVPDREAIGQYLIYGYVPSPWSAFRGIRKLPPAHYIVAGHGEVRVHRYWSLRYTPKRTDPEPALGEELISQLEEAVRLRLVADVPLGALLSGGIDSSTVVALMRRVTSGPVQTFSIGFDQREYDELAYARQVARRFETSHHELVVKPDVVSMLPRLVWHYNEPFADSSALPSLALCQMARDFVTVALNGDGGDEVFLGYDRYLGAAIGAWYDRIPGWLGRLLARGIALLPRSAPKSRIHGLRRLAEALPLEPRQRYARWLTVFEPERDAELFTPDFAAEISRADPLGLLEGAYAASDAPDFVEATAHVDIQLYLPDDLLVKMDIASMAHSLEVRSPFLDHELVEFAASLPARLKLRRLTRKYVLKRVMKGVLPDPVIGRRKMGFGLPIDHWFRDELREMVHDVLLDPRARARGYFRPEVVRRTLDDHVHGRAHHHTRLWSLLILELWHRTFIDQAMPGRIS